MWNGLCTPSKREGVLQKQEDNAVAAAMRLAKQKEAMQITKEKAPKPVLMQVQHPDRVIYMLLHTHGHVCTEKMLFKHLKAATPLARSCLSPFMATLLLS